MKKIRILYNHFLNRTKDISSTTIIIPTIYYYIKQMIVGIVVYIIPITYNNGVNNVLRLSRLIIMNRYNIIYEKAKYH